jgi:hypothetical protein
MQKQALVFWVLWAAFMVTTLFTMSTADHENACPDGACLVESLADIPPQLRTPNYAPYGQGSCVHASTVTLLEWQGQHELAKWWKANYNSGEYANRLINRMEAAGLRYAYTKSGSVEFLEWASRNRMGAGIFYYPRHAVNLVDLNEKEAVLLDNNRVDNYIRVPREEFIENWLGWGGFAWTVCYSPPPAWPEW